MNVTDILNILKNDMKIAVFATVDQEGKPHARHAHIGMANEKGIFFMTGNTTNFYQQLSQNPHVALTAIQQEGYLVHVVRIEGKAVEIGRERLLEVLDGNPYAQHVYPTDGAQQTMRVFHLYEGDGFYHSLSQGHKYVFKIGSDSNETRALT